MRTTLLAALCAVACAPVVEKTPWAFEAAPPAPPEAQAAPPGAGGPEDESGPALQVEYVEPSPEPRARATELTLQWPLPATGVTSLFGERNDPLNGARRFHYGIDLESRYGEVVRAAAAGRVMQAGFNAGHGRQVVLSHVGGFQSGYSHLAQALVYEGTWVEAGTPIGFVGTSGRSTGPHLHLEVTRWGVHIDPLEVLGVRVPLE